MQPPATGFTMLGIIAASWGAIGLLGLLIFAVVRLTGVITAGFEFTWYWQHIVTAIASTVFMAWSEGYRGFQKGLSPRAAARVKWLLRHPSAVHALLAPLFVLGYFGTTRRRAIAAWALLIGIGIAIVIVHILPQPWRAALDIGVVVGLAWGAISFVAALGRTLAAPGYPVSPEVGVATSSD